MSIPLCLVAATLRPAYYARVALMVQVLMSGIMRARLDYRDPFVNVVGYRGIGGDAPPQVRNLLAYALQNEEHQRLHDCDNRAEDYWNNLHRVSLHVKMRGGTRAGRG